MNTIIMLIAMLLPTFAIANNTDFTDKPYPITGTAPASAKKFDAAFINLLKTWHVPGAAVAIMENGELVLSRGYGWADIEKQQPVQPNSLFRIASVSKVITATAVLKLIEDEKLKLNAKVFDVLSDLRPITGRKFKKNQRKITVKHLLHMSSGWIARGKHRFDPMFGSWPRSIRKMMANQQLPASCETMTRMMMTLRLHHKPGARYAYSNLDYCVLSMLVSKITADGYDYQGYEHYVKNTLLKPLGITTMHIGSTTREKAAPNEVSYYRYLGQVDISHQTPSTYFPYGDDAMLKKNSGNGGWVACAPDLVRFIDALAAGKILSDTSLALMTAPPPFTKKKNQRYFGMGWKFKTVNNDKIWYQTGSFTGTSAVVIHKPDGVSIAVLFNSRPPIYHMWKDFRPQLYKFFNAQHDIQGYQTT